jgi:hypothetical protein
MGFDLAPFCTTPMPNQKRRLPIDPRRLASAWLARNASQSSSQAYLGREWPRGHQATPFIRVRSAHDNSFDHPVGEETPRGELGLKGHALPVRLQLCS